MGLIDVIQLLLGQINGLIAFIGVISASLMFQSFQIHMAEYFEKKQIIFKKLQMAEDLGCYKLPKSVENKKVSSCKEKLIVLLIGCVVTQVVCLIMVVCRSEMPVRGVRLATTPRSRVG